MEIEFTPYTITINPGPLTNRKRLFTTQNFIDMTKLRNALDGRPSVIEEPPSGWILQKEGKVCYVIGDGNHRLGLAAVDGNSIELRIIGVWDNRSNVYRFNNIIQKVRQELGHR